MIADAKDVSEDQRRDEALCRLLNTPSRNDRPLPGIKPDAEDRQQGPPQPTIAGRAADIVEPPHDSPPGGERSTPSSPQPTRG